MSFETSKFVSRDEYHRLTKNCPIEAGDVLYTAVGSYGNSAVVPNDKTFVFQRHIAHLKPRHNLIDATYLSRMLETPPVRRQAERLARGVAQKTVTLTSLRDFEIPLPPLEEQKRIAAILDKADQLRQKRRQAIALLDSLTQSIFLEMFGHGNPEWPNVELRDAVKQGTIVTYGIVQAGEEFEGGVPYIRTGDIKDGAIDCSGLRHTDPKIAAKFARSRVEAGEIVMSIRATVGTFAQVPSELHGANLTQGTARIAPGEKFTTEYMLSYLRSASVQNWIQRQVKGATFREITLTRLRELNVVVPPMQLQIEFSNAVTKLREMEMQFKISQTGSESVFASLQHRAFTGQL